VLAIVFSAPVHLGINQDINQDKVKLRLNLANDDVIRYRATNSMSQSTILPKQFDEVGGNMDLTMEHEMEMEQRVVSRASDGSVTLACKILSLHGRLKGLLEKEVEFDSSKVAEDDSLSKMMAAMAGKSIELLLDADSKIVAVRGMDEIIKSGLHELKKDEDQAQFVSLMQQMFSDENLKSSWSNFFSPLPRDPVGVGDAWTDESGISSPFAPTAVNFLYKVKAIDADGIDVAIEGTMKTKPADPEPPAEPAKESEPAQLLKDLMAKTKMEAAGSGTARFSRRDGLLIKHAMTMAMSMTMPSPDGGDSIKMKYLITSTFERVPNSERK
jgi:hypothetical protein